MLKKIIACLLLVSLLTLGLVACKEDKPETPTPDISDSSDSSDTNAPAGEDTNAPAGNNENNNNNNNNEGNNQGGSSSGNQSQAPNEVFDPTEGNDDLVNDNHWTPQY